MTNRADQNWPEEMSYELTICAASDNGALLGSDNSVRAVVDNAALQVEELIALVETVCNS